MNSSFCELPVIFCLKLAPQPQLWCISSISYEAYNLLFLILFYHTFMFLRLLIIINPNQQNLPSIFCNRLRIFFLGNLLKSRFRILIPFQFYYERWIISFVFWFIYINSGIQSSLKSTVVRIHKSSHELFSEQNNHAHHDLSLPDNTLFSTSLNSCSFRINPLSYFSALFPDATYHILYRLILLPFFLFLILETL